MYSLSQLELTILRGLIYDEAYTRKVLPYIEKSYFENTAGRTLFELCKRHFEEYGSCPDYGALGVEIEGLSSLDSRTFESIASIYKRSLDEKPTDERQWRIDKTEEWCKERAVYLAILESISIHEGKSKKHGREAIPQLLMDAIAVGFDDHIGHDYFENYEERYDFYHNQEERISMGLTYFDKITKGGLPNKTLTVCLAGTNVGKSLFMCSVASDMLMRGKNVLYITLEMAEERIAERIDANLLNVNLDDIETLPHQIFESKVQAIQRKTQGKLYIKEYPTASAHAGHFEALLKELEIKKSFRPDIVFIDYINICLPMRFGLGANVNSYTIVKAIAEELRGLAAKQKLPIVTATQTTRSGFASTDPSLTDTSESFGLPATADFMFSMSITEELENLNQIQIKQLKNRLGSKQTCKKFVVGVDYNKMRLYDVEASAQNNVLETNGTEFETDTESKFRNKFEEFCF